MNLFGTHLGGEAIASLVAMLATLVLWVGVLRNQRSNTHWIRRKLAEREAKQQAETEQTPPARPTRAAPGAEPSDRVVGCAVSEG